MALDCHHLGHTLTLRGKLDEARGLIGWSIAILSAHPEFVPFRHGFARWRLAQWHEASGNRAEALRGEAKGAEHQDTIKIRDWFASVRAAQLGK